MELRKLTENDLLKFKLLYNVEAKLLNNYYAIIDSTDKLLVNSSGILHEQKAMNLSVINDRFILAYSYSTGYTYILTKYGVFQSEFSGISKFKSNEDVALITTDKAEQFVINERCKHTNVSNYFDYMNIIKLDDGNFALIRIIGVHEYIDLIDSEFKSIEKGIELDEQFRKKYNKQLSNGY